MAYIETTVHYLTLDSPCYNKQQAVYPLPIKMPNGEIITSTHTALLSNQDLPIQSQKAHIFPGLNKALLSIGTLCDHGCEATFNEESVLVLNIWIGKIILKGTRNPRTNLHMLNLTQRNNLMTESTTHDEYFAGSAYKCKSKSTLVNYQHVSCWSPTQYRWGKAITKTFSLLGQAYHLTWCTNIYQKKNQLYLGTFSNLEKVSDQHRKR